VTTRQKSVLIPVAAALPGLLAAGAGWLEADAAQKRAAAQKMEKQQAWDSYSQYIIEQMKKGCQSE
jgi:hypothetical protein